MRDHDDVVGGVPVRPGLEEGRVGPGGGGGVVGYVGDPAGGGVGRVEGQGAGPASGEHVLKSGGCQYEKSVFHYQNNNREFFSYLRLNMKH